MGKKKATNTPATIQKNVNPAPAVVKGSGPKSAGTVLGGPHTRSLTPTDVSGEEVSFSSIGLCLQCDLLTHAVEEAIKTFSSNSQNNLHLVMKEIHHMCVEIGRCCGRPEYSDDDESRSTSLSSPRQQIFWEQLRNRIENDELRQQEQQHASPLVPSTKVNRPFKPPARPPAISGTPSQPPPPPPTDPSTAPGAPAEEVKDEVDVSSK